MIILNYLVENQHITYKSTDTELIADSVNYVMAHFDFFGEDWEKVKYKTAVFRSNNKNYTVILDEKNNCTVPNEVLQYDKFFVGAVGSFEDEKLISFATYYTITEVMPSIKSYGIDCEGVLTPSQYDQIMALIKDAPTKTSDLINDSNFVNLAMMNEALSYKVNKVEGKGLSSNDFTDEEKAKLTNIEDGANENKLESISVNGEFLTIVKKNVDIKVPTKTSDIINDSGYIQAVIYKNVVVSVESFISDTTFDTYKYKADITLDGVKESDYANISFSIDDVKSKNYASVCTTSANTVTIYSKDIPSEDITIPLIEVKNV